MHLQPDYGLTLREVEALGLQVFPFVNFGQGDSMAQIVSKTISGLEDYLSAFPADYLVVHGDRPEALAGAIVGIMKNIRVVHVEGGELSGTVDESVRHAITKMSHIHLVSNSQAEQRVRGLGESPSSIFKIGSPELDVMSSPELPSLQEVCDRYGLDASPHCLFVMHPVTTQDSAILASATRQILQTLSQIENLQVVAIAPNNDQGSQQIREALAQFRELRAIKTFPSMRFEHYITALKNAQFIIGNSSSGVREAPFFGVPTINVGSRQLRRSSAVSITNIQESQLHELKRIINNLQGGTKTPSSEFGDGQAAKRFGKLVGSERFRIIPIQKQLDEI
jgi:UDP-N-acetylglucosamine 2-epimerase (hydrolysing)